MDLSLEGFSIPLAVLHFSPAYDADPSFLTDIPHVRLDMGDISGCDCYCDEQAQARILERLPVAPMPRVRLLDSGNYHYMSYLWMKQVHEPFSLLVFDNHTDMQPSSFGKILSCGGWIASALEENPCLEAVILVGPDEEAFGRTDLSLRGRVHFFSREELREGTRKLRSFLDNLSPWRPLYLSLDKDILRPEDAVTDWSQGDLEGVELLSILEGFFCSWQEKKGRLLAFDICGDAKEAKGPEARANMQMNRKLLALCHRHEALFREEGSRSL